jgi:hypothetical protein
LRDTTEPLSTSTPPRKAQPASGARNRAQHQRALRQHLGVAAVRYVRGDRHGPFMPAPWRGGLVSASPQLKPAAGGLILSPRDSSTRPSALSPSPRARAGSSQLVLPATPPTPQHALRLRRVPGRSELINARLGSSETRGPRSVRRDSLPRRVFHPLVRHCSHPDPGSLRRTTVLQDATFPSSIRPPRDSIPRREAEPPIADRASLRGGVVR